MRVIVKNMLLLFAGLMVMYVAEGQTIGRQLFGSGGSNSVPLNGTYYVSWSMGEPVVHTIDMNLPQLTQGFQQPETVLPLHPHAISLKAEKNGEDVLLNWTDNKEGEYQYLVQYWEREWRTLDSLTLRNYRHVMPDANNNTLQYRIVAKSPDASIRMSNVVEIHRGETTEPVVFPNPASRFIYVKNVDETAQLSLFTKEGKSLISETGNKLDLQGLSGGMYLLLIEQKDGKRTFKKVEKQ